MRTPRGYLRGGHARQQRVEGMATTLVHSAQGKGTVLHPCACHHRVERLGLHPYAR